MLKGGKGGKGKGKDGKGKGKEEALNRMLEEEATQKKAEEETKRKAECASCGVPVEGEASYCPVCQTLNDVLISGFSSEEEVEKKKEEEKKEKKEEALKRLAEKEAAQKRCPKCNKPSIQNTSQCFECKFDEAARKKAEEE